MAQREICGYKGSETDPDQVLHKLIELGGHNNLHLIPNNPAKIYYLLPNKTISCKWVEDLSVSMQQMIIPKKNPFHQYIVDNILAFCAYEYDSNTIWNPDLGFIHIPEGAPGVVKTESTDAMLKEFQLKAKQKGYIYIKNTDCWKFNIAKKSPCFYKENSLDLYWSIGVFLGYDDNGNAMIDRGTDSTLICRACQCVAYKSFSDKVDSLGQICDKIVNIHYV